MPESWTRFEARGTYTGNSASVTANYRYWDGKNTGGKDVANGVYYGVVHAPSLEAKDTVFKMAVIK